MLDARRSMLDADESATDEGRGLARRGQPRPRDRGSAAASAFLCCSDYDKEHRNVQNVTVEHGAQERADVRSASSSPLRIATCQARLSSFAASVYVLDRDAGVPRCERYLGPAAAVRRQWHLRALKLGQKHARAHRTASSFRSFFSFTRDLWVPATTESTDRTEEPM